MGTIINFVWKLIGIAVSAAMIGNLVDMTMMVGKHAVKANKRGIINLKKWNEQLHSKD